MIFLIASGIPDQMHQSRGIFALKLAYYLSFHEDVCLYYPLFRGNIIYSLGLLNTSNESHFKILPLASFPGLNKFSQIQVFLWTCQLYFKIIKHSPESRICIISYFFLPGSLLFSNLKRLFTNITTVIHHSESKNINTIASASKVNISLVLQNTNLLIFNNPAYEACILNFLQDRKIKNNLRVKFVPSGFDELVINRALLSKENNKSINCKPKNHLSLACIGTITPRKGQSHIIKSLISLDLFMQNETNLKYKKVSLNLIGPIEYSLNLPALYHVEFNLFGSLSHDECLSQMIKSDLICQPSTSEGMSNAVVEALALNKPLIVSDIPSNRYLIAERSRSLLPSINTYEHLFDILKNLVIGKLTLSSLIPDTRNIISLTQRAYSIHRVLYK